MNPRLRLWLFILLGAVLGIAIGVNIADESYGWASLVALACCWVIAERSSDAPPDAWLLGAAVVGYIIGNRGFAQIQPAAGIPLLPAEAVLLVAVPALLARIAMKRTAGFHGDLLNYSILVWVVIGSARLPLDMRRYGVIALRDFAMIYYSAFFFVGQAFGADGPSLRVLRNSLTFGFLGLLPAVVVNELAPDFLLTNFTFHGIPIIFQKSDLIATSLAAGFFWLWTRANSSRNRLWFLPAAASLLLVGVTASPRAAMAGVGLTTILWLTIGRWRIAAAQFGIIAAASILVLAIAGFSGRDLRTTAPYSAYEHAVSIFDPQGTGNYINAESGDPGGNNRFRLIWWRDVIDETLTTSPAFGLGFGSDLATRFLADYDLLSDENFSARSPHSMMVTVFGRMGIVGFLAWLAVSAAIATLVWRLFRRGQPDGIGLASVVCVTWISACVGVVLESPMGAIVFWTTLGLASSVAREAKDPAGADSEPSRDERPVAKPGALDTETAIR
jgi:hypothetical protein